MLSRLAASLCLNVFLLLPITPLPASPSSSSAFTVVRDQAETLTPAALAAAQKRALIGDVSVSQKFITLVSRSAPLVAVTGPDTDMLSYRIAGLRNPALIVRCGAIFTVLFANTDDDMFHNIRFGPAQMRFPNVMTAALTASVGTPPLAHRSAAAIHAAKLTLRAPTVPSTYAYFCTVRGHAQGGMTGLIIVR